MKRIEEVRDLNIGDLERIADDSSVEIPEGLDDRVLSAIIASSADSTAPRGRNIWKILPGVAAAGIAACLAIMFAMSDQPKDTFDDPRLAYAELERAMSLISSKMERGMEIAAEAAPAIEMTDRIMNGKIEIE